MQFVEQKFFLSSFLKALIVFLIYRLLSWTWKISLREAPELELLRSQKKAFILAHWHGDELALLAVLPIYRVATLVSTSKDGQIMDFVFRWLGGVTARGSSTRQSLSGLRQLMRLIQEGYSTSFAVDGPKGPRYHVKPGVFEMSQRFEIPIFGCSVKTSSSWKFPRSWNKTYLPKPFSKVEIEWRGPLQVPKNSADVRDESLQKALKNILGPACD